jgi:hypothetical protein
VLLPLRTEPGLFESVPGVTKTAAILSNEQMTNPIAQEVRDDSDTRGVDSDDAQIPDNQEGDLTHQDEDDEDDEDKEAYDDGEIVGPDGERG